MRLFAVLAMLVLLVGCSGQQEPVETATMLHAVFHVTSPEFEAAGIESPQQKLWRVGDERMRREAPPDPQTGLELVLITVDKDVWMHRKNDLQVIHGTSTDSLPTSRAPLFSGSRVEGIQDLEIGNEVDFFTTNNATVLDPAMLDSVQCDVYELAFDSTVFTLYVNQESGHPEQVGVEGDMFNYSVVYDVYQPGLPVDTMLFVLPEGAVVSEAPQQ
jgi:hypothetical protein